MSRSAPRRPRTPAAAPLTDQSVIEGSSAGAWGGDWGDRANAAGAALVVVGLLHSLAVSLYDVDLLRRNGGSGNVGQITLSGFYSLTLVVGVVLLSVPGGGALLRTSRRQAFLAVAVGAAAFIGIAQLVEVYATLVQPAVAVAPPWSQRFWLTLSPLGDLLLSAVAGWLALASLRGADSREDSVDASSFLRGAVLLGVVAAVLVQVGAAAGSTGRATLPGPNTQTPSATQLPLPAG
jgi:hypothetical protein